MEVLFADPSAWDEINYADVTSPASADAGYVVSAVFDGEDVFVNTIGGVLFRLHDRSPKLLPPDAPAALW